VLKKIQLRYSDYEVPKAVRDSISQLRKIFDGLRENQGKDVAAIFAGITHPDTQEVKIKDFVAKLARQDPTLREDDLYKCCSVLDRDGNGSITLDEFLEFFGDVEDSEADLKAAEEELQDEMWPDWLIKEGQLSTAQGLLTKMHTVLDREHGITAEEAFGVYDIKDTGDCSVDEFRRILKIFFGEVFSQDGDLEFLMRLAQPRASRVDYRDFCKYLSKRAVRAFKSAPGPAADGQDGGGKSGAGPLRELETPLQKEATLTYVLRKAAELELDVRKRFLDHDKNELNVIPRSRFVGLLLDLPLGINEVDVQEILENDLNFDNYGNVDYTAILNSDLFCHLERARLKAAHKKRKGVRVAASADDEQGAKPGQEPEKVDNRKVVVEDLIYIDDLEILIYTTVAPKMSTAFITSVKKSPGPSTAKMETKIMTLQTLGG
jgi:Ca2+-binding EF-hand superfamily protein